VAEEDWAEVWKHQYHRLHVGQQLVLVPAWEEYSPGDDEHVIYLEPGMAFGTGLHATTRLCLRALELESLQDAAILDVGTGSGVLAIAAARLGAASVLALDSDPVAVAAAQQNVEANSVSGQVAVRRGSLPGGDGLDGYFEVASGLDLLTSGSFDLIVVNILAPVISGMASSLANRLRLGGKLIASGLIASQESETAQVLVDHGLEIIRREQEGDWICLVAGKGY
jgi:ribosomal protein L11 methyltransferase